jgi:hypothetical protein
MLTVTLAQLKTQSRQRADMENSTLISDPELTTIINSSAAELHDLLIGVYEDYKLSSSTLSVTPNVDTYSLPNDFYKLRGVDLVLDSAGNAVTLKPFNFQERNSYLYTPTWNVVGLSYLRYHILGNSIRFVPVPSTSQTVKLWYIPAVTKLVLDTDTLDGVNGFEEYIIIDAAMKMRIKEETDISELVMQKEAMKQRINAMASGRDASQPERIADVTKQIPIEFWSYPGGSP